MESPPVTLPLGLGTTPFIPYVGSGTWDLDFETQLSKAAFSSTCVGEGDSQCDPTNPQDGAFDGKVFWNLENITVTYTYMASVEVPVPAPLWLFGAGLAAAAAVTRRKNRN